MTFSIVLAVGVLAGFYLKSDETTIYANQENGKFNEVLRYIHHYYVDSVEIDELADIAISNVFEQLDPHSEYIPKSLLTAVNEPLRGYFEGIGIEFRVMEDTISVVATLNGGPSEKLGILPGDRIIEINDTLVAGVKITNEDVIKKLKGKRGTRVKVSIARPGVADLLPFEIERDRVDVPSVEAAYMIDDEIGLIRLATFNDSTMAELRKGFRKLEKAGFKKLILDLRGNGGGYLHQAEATADELLDGRKLVVYTDGLHSHRSEYFTRVRGAFESGDLVILVDEQTASASEIVSGAVQDHQRGTIIGRRTYGKGLVQQQFRLRDGSAMRLTTARYYTPNGRCIQRPYAQGVERYREEYWSRLMNEYNGGDSTAASDTVDWGIQPDVYLPVDTTPSARAYRRLWRSGAIAQYSYAWRLRNADQLKAYTGAEDFRKNFVVNWNVSSELVKVAKSMGMQVDENVVRQAEAQIRNGVKAQIGRQLFYLDAYYPVLFDGDTEVLAAVKHLKGTASR